MKQLNDVKLLQHLPPRKPDGHKGDFGHVAIVGGNISMAGAPVLAALGSFRVGAGIVSVLTHPKHALVPTLIAPEIQTVAVEDGDALKQALNRATVIVCGPGLGQDDWALSLFQDLSNSVPILLDADALHLLARFPYKNSNWVLTPHLGEAAALLNTTTDVLRNDREKAVHAIQKQYGGVVVLKGHPSLIALPNDDVTYACAFGNPGMATAGMGDVLSGVIAGFIAQGLSLSIAAKLGVVLHAKAGDAAREASGARGMMATDLLPFLRKLVN